MVAKFFNQDPFNGLIRPSEAELPRSATIQFVPSEGLRYYIPVNSSVKRSVRAVCFVTQPVPGDVVFKSINAYDEVENQLL